MEVELKKVKIGIFKVDGKAADFIVSCSMKGQESWWQEWIFKRDFKSVVLPVLQVADK